MGLIPGKIGGGFPVKCRNGAHLGVNKRSFSGYAQKKAPIFAVFEPIGGIFPSIQAIFDAIF
jgi:hypothetical protein